MRSFSAWVLMTSLSVIVSSLISLPAHADPDPVCEEKTTIVDMSMSWTVHDSWRSYMASPMAGATETLSDGVERDSSSSQAVVPYIWPSSSQESTEYNSFDGFIGAGSVHWSAHGGVLSIAVKNPRIEKAGDSWNLTVEAEGASRSGVNLEDLGRVTLSSLDGMKETKDGDNITITFENAVFSQGAAQIFGYTEGDSTAVPTVHITTKTEANCVTPSASASDSPSSSPSESDTSLPSPSASSPSSSSTPDPSPSADEDPVCIEWSGPDAQSIPKARGNQGNASDGTLNWGISTYALEWAGEADCESATYSQGVHFTDGKGTYDPETNETHIVWSGGYSLYPYKNSPYGSGLMKSMRFVLGNPELTISADGSGSLVYDVATINAQGESSEFKRVTVASFAPGALSVTSKGGNAYSFNGIPSYAEQTYDYVNSRTGDTGTAQGAFPAEFIDALDASMNAYFYNSGAKGDVKKPALPIDGTFVFALNETHNEEQTNTDNNNKQTQCASLQWSVKESWRNYINGVAGGNAEFSSGLSSTYAWPSSDSVVTSVEELPLSFQGSVHYTGHGGVLDVTLTHPRIAKEGENYYLYLNTRSKQMSTGEFTSYDNIPFAILSNVRVSADKKRLSADAAISAQGSQVLGGNYKEGTELDPVTVTVSQDCEVARENSSQSSTGAQAQASTSVSTPKSNVLTTSSGDGCVIDVNSKKVVSGSLAWGIRSSFTTYIRSSIANGSISGSAWKNGTISFPVTSGNYNTATKSGTINYSGSVHFTGHGGVLDMTMSSPRLVISGNTATLYISVKSNDATGKQAINASNVRFATVALAKNAVAGNTLDLSASSVTLTSDGAKAFAGFYNVGEKLDTFNGSYALTQDVTCSDSTGLGSLASTGWPVLGAIGTSLLVLFVGIAALRRRAALMRN